MRTRRFLLTRGPAAVVVAGALSGCGPNLEVVRAPWREAGEDFADPRLDALSYAILAPNPHNMQPWRVRLEGEDAFTLYAASDKLLPETDPPNRQITIGLGAFLALFRMAAAEAGYRATIEPFPQGEPEPVLDGRPIARVVLSEDASAPRDPLFAHVLDRRTVRGRYRAGEVPGAPEMAALEAAVLESGAPAVSFGWTSDPELVAFLIKATQDAWRIEMETPATARENSENIRLGAAAVRARPEGVPIAGGLPEILAKAGLLTEEEFRKPGSVAFDNAIKFYNDDVAGTSAFAWFGSPRNGRADQLAFGTAWLRFQLAAAKLGVATHPTSQALQEYREVADIYDAVQARLGYAAPARVQALFRIGRADYPEPAPRWPLATRLLDA